MTGPSQSGRAHSNLIALMGIGALLLFALSAHSCLFQGLGFDVFGNRGYRSWSIVPFSLLGLGGLLQVGLAVWVGYDAHRRGLNGFLWGLLVLFTFIVGLIVYLIVGPSMARGEGPFRGDWAAGLVTPGPAPPVEPAPATAPETTCPHCAAAIEADFKVCPYCAGSLRCAGCDSPLQRDWKVCPRCGIAIPRADPS